MVRNYAKLLYDKYFFNVKNTYCVVCLILNFDIYMYYLKYADI